MSVGRREAETGVLLVLFRLRHRFVLRAATADRPVGTCFEVRVNVIEKAHDVRVGPKAGITKTFSVE